MGQFTQLQILEPQVGKFSEGAAEVEQPACPESGPVEQALLQAGSSGRLGASSTRRAAELAFYAAMADNSA